MYYTKYGKIIYNPEAYAATGAPMYNSDGEDVNEETSIYVAKLENGKRYIGKTKDFDRRCNQHFSGTGSMVTRKYSPVKIKEVEVVPGYFADECEQEHTDRYICKYGYSNVRGGRYTNSKNF
jgi:predicted GIY-YIG superfamily endonuclease